MIDKSNRALPAVVLLCAALLLAATAARAQGAAVARPNVILILTDDQGWWTIGANGNRLIETPVIDRLAAQGVRFTHFYASPVCTPTRAALLTGRHYQRTGAMDRALDLEPMSEKEVTLGNVFRSASYATALIGKWHLGRYMKYHPNANGFDEFFGFWRYGFINNYFDSDELEHNKEPVAATGYITDVLTDQAIAFVKRNTTRPFFLYLAYNAPHVPHLVPDGYAEKYLKKGIPLDDARTYGMIEAIDGNVGRLLEEVRRDGLDERTIVIFMSDNGGIDEFFRAGLRGGKGSVYEGGVRVPFIARWPGRFPAGAVVDAPVQHIDVFPTLCELTGAPAPGKVQIDGRSLAPLLKAGRGASPHDFVFHQWTRVEGPRSGEPERRGVLDVRRNLKLVSKHPEDLVRDPDKLRDEAGASEVRYELFDLARDPGESRDVSAAHPDVVRDLRQRYERWFADVSAGWEWSKVPVPIEVGREDENPVELDLFWARLAGKKLQRTFRHYARNSTENWSSVEDSLRWNVDVVRDGRYDVILDYGCDPADAGSRFVVRAGDSRVEGTVRATAGNLVFRRDVVGSLVLHKGTCVVEIKPISIAKRELMTLNKLSLRWSAKR